MPFSLTAFLIGVAVFGVIIAVAHYATRSNKPEVKKW